MKTGEIVNKSKLIKTYDKHALSVLGDKLSSVPQEKKGEWPKFTVLSDLPTVEEYRKQKDQRYTTTVECLVSDAFGAIENLAGEMREWYDNMPDVFKDGDKGSQVSEVADTLEGMSPPDVDTDAGALPVIFYPNLDTSSRAARASEAAEMLRTAIQALEEAQDEGDKGEGEDVPDYSNLISELEDAAGEIEGVEFPGMFG